MNTEPPMTPKASRQIRRALHRKPDRQIAAVERHCDKVHRIVATEQARRAAQKPADGVQHAAAVSSPATINGVVR